MKYVEFLVFLCRITHEHYQSTEHKAESFYKQLDHLLPVFLDYARLKCDWNFEDLFATEIKEQYRNFMRRKRKFLKEEQKAKALGNELDPKIVLEFKEFEKNVKQMGINTDAIIVKSGGQDSDSEEEVKEKKKFLTVKEIIENQSENLLSIKHFRT